MASLVKNIAANYIGKTWATILSILFIPFYLKFMGIEAFGLVGFYTTLVSVFGILDLGISATLNRELARHSVKDGSADSQRDLVRTLELIYWGVAIIACSIILLIAPFIAHTWINLQILTPASVIKAVKLMSIAVALNFPISLYQGGLMGLQRQVLLNIVLIITGTLRSGGAILVLWLVSPTIEAFFAWQVFSSIVSSIAFYIAIWSILPKAENNASFKPSIIKVVWKYALAVSVNGIIGVILSQLDKIILSKMLTLKMFGYYVLAGTLASSIWLIIVPFNNAIFPRFVQYYEAKESKKLTDLFHKSTQLLSLLLFPVSALLIFFSAEIILLWTHDPNIAAYIHLIVSFLVIGIMINGIATVPGYSASAFGWPLLVTYTNLIQAIFAIPLIIIMVYWLKGVGASISWIVMSCTQFFLLVPVFFRRYLIEEKWKWYLSDIAKPMIASFAVSLLSWAIAPKLESTIIIIVWIATTGIISLIATGLTLPAVRSWGLNNWIIWRNHNIIDGSDR